MCVCQNLCLHFFPNSVGLRVCGSGVGSRMVLIVPTIYGLWVGIFYTNWEEHEMGRHFLYHLGGHLIAITKIMECYEGRRAVCYLFC